MLFALGLAKMLAMHCVLVCNHKGLPFLFAAWRCRPPFIYEHIGIDCMRMQEALDAADVTGGLSLGEYTALTFAGAMRYCTVCTQHYTQSA